MPFVSGMRRVRGMHMRSDLALAIAGALALPIALAGCTASGASSGNFELIPERVGWYTGDTAQFTLNITPSVTRQAPGYTIDRYFAIEEIRFEERGAAYGGDYETRDPNDVNLTLMQNGAVGEEFPLDGENPTITILIDVPQKLRDSEYVLELKLFKVGWVKSEPFRVDERSTT